MHRSRFGSPLVFVGVLLMLGSIGLLSAVNAGWRESFGNAGMNKMTAHVDVAASVPAPAALTLPEAKQLKKNWKSGMLSLSDERQESVKTGFAPVANSAVCDVVGVNDAYRSFHQIRILAGASISEASVAGHSRVAILGESTAEQLFHSAGVLGRTIDINGTPFSVIGVMADPDSLLAQLSDDGMGKVLVPVTTLMDVDANAGIDSMEFAAKPDAFVDGEQEVDNALKAIGKNPSQYRIINDEILYRLISQQRKILFFLYGILAVLMMALQAFKLAAGTRLDLNRRLQSEDWRDIFRNRSLLPLLRRSFYMAGLVVCMVVLWRLIRFQLFLPPGALPDEIIDLSAYLDMFRSMRHLQVMHAGYVPTPQEWVSSAAGRMEGWLVFAGLGGLPALLYGVRFWVMNGIPAVEQLQRFLMFIAAAEAAAFGLARLTGLDYSFGLYDAAVPAALICMLVIRQHAKFVQFEKGE